MVRLGKDRVGGFPCGHGGGHLVFRHQTRIDRAEYGILPVRPNPV
jgi:hypothetical protein